MTAREAESLHFSFQHIHCDLLCFFSPEWVLYSDVAVDSDGQQAEDGALGEDEDEAGDEEAAEKVGTEADTGVGLQENITGYKKKHKKTLNNIFLKI